MKEGYIHRVEADNPTMPRWPLRNVLYDGPDAADAMAAWSKAISDGDEYVTLESLFFRPAGTSADPGQEAWHDRQPG